MSFYTYEYIAGCLKLDVQTLIDNGFAVRLDGEKVVTKLFTDEVYIEPNTESEINFPAKHVTVWHPDEKVWEKWYENDTANVGSREISEQLALFALAIVTEEDAS